CGIMAVVAAAGVAASRPSKALWELRILGSRGGVLESAAEQAAAADRLSFSILLLGSSLGRPLSRAVRRLRWLAIKGAKNCGFAAVGEHAGSWQSLRPPELRLRGRRRHCGSCGFSAAGGGVGVSRRTSCCSGPPLLLDSVARVVIGAAAEQSRSASEMVGNKECEECGFAAV